MVELGIIDEHYPLHRLKSHKDIVESLETYFDKLEVNLIRGDWEKYSQPINLIKKYYGERYAFYFFYFCTYQSHLGIVAFIGTALGIYQYYLFTNSHNMESSIDNMMNCVYGVVLCVWSSVFVENWKKK